MITAQRLKNVIIIIFIIVAAFGQCTAVAADKMLSLTFGLYQSQKSTTMYRQFSPIIDAIQTEMAEQLNCPVDIHIEIFRTYAEGNNALVSGKVDFVRFGPSSYVIAKERNPMIRILAMESRNGEKTFEGIIAVRSDSKIRSLSDLEGKSFAFGSRDSTIGRYLAQSELLNAGIRAASLSGYDFLGRHDRVASSIEVGDHDAGSMKDSVFETYRETGRLRALHRFDNVTQPWIARGSLPDEVFNSIKSALLNLDDPDILSTLKISGFLKSDDSEYHFVREAMKKAESFEE